MISEVDEMLTYANTAEETKKALEMGANVNIEDDRGKTALMLAQTAEQTKLFSYDTLLIIIPLRVFKNAFSRFYS